MYVCVLGGHVYMCVRRSDLISVSAIFLLTFETVPIVWYCFPHFITLVKISFV